MSSDVSAGDCAPQPCASSSLSLSLYTAAPGSTVASRSRALSVQHRREMVKATVKDVDVVHQGLKRLETRMHELESRVQYVNPWVVQHMWELLCDLREKIGVHYNIERERTWMEEMQKSGHQRGRAQPTTEPKVTTSPQCGKAEVVPAVIAGGAVSFPVTPVRLFDRSGGEVNEVDTSVSSESDEDCDKNDEEVYGVLGREDMNEFDASINRIQGRDGGAIANNMDSNARDRLKYRRHVEGYLRKIEERWEVYRIVQDELTARMELILEESTYRNFLLSHLVSTLTTSVGRSKTVVSSPESEYLEMGSRAHQGAMQHQMESRYRISNRNSKTGCDLGQRKQDDFDFPSPPRSDLPSGMSPIQVTESFSELFSPQTGSGRRKTLREGNRNEIRSTEETHECGDAVQNGIRIGHTCRGDDGTMAVVNSLFSDNNFMQKLVDDVSRRLAALIQQSDMTTYNNDSPSQTLPSALLLIVREAVNSIAGAHDEVISRQLQDCLNEEQRKREAREEGLWQHIEEHMTTWERQNTVAHKEREEMLQQHQQLVVRGKGDAELCGEVRRELLKLCEEVMRAVEHMHGVPPVTLPVPPVGHGESVCTVGPDGDGRYDRMELRLETLSAAVKSLYAEVEVVRQRAATLLPPTAVDERLAGLREAVADVREAVTIVARRSLAVDERLREVEQRLDERHPSATPLETFLDPPPPPLPLPSLPDGRGGQGHVNRMSVEEAMVDTQRVLLTHNGKDTTAIYPFVKAVSALFSTLQQLNHLYNVGTGTFGGSLQLIFAMPPFSLPRTLVPVCQTYLREHSAAELKESLNALGIMLDVSEVLSSCYYWMQSHVLAVGGRYGACVQTGDAGESGASVSLAPSSIPLHSGVGMTSGETVPLPCTSGKTTADALKNTQKVLATHKTTQNGSCDIATQTELLTTTHLLSSSSSTSHETKPCTHSTSKSSERKKNYIQEEKQKQDEKQVAAAFPTALETSALCPSQDKTFEPVSGVVHHYHHHHYNCFLSNDDAHTTPSRCVADEENNLTPNSYVPQTTGKPSNGEGEWEALDRRRREQQQCNTVQHMEPPLLDTSEASAPSPVPIVNRSHVFTDKRGEVDVDGSTNNPGYPLPNMILTPSLYSECLPLPTAVSCFTDPGQVTRAGGPENAFLKNSQPFYTATLQRVRRTQHLPGNQGRSSREGISGGAETLHGGPRVRNGGSYETMHRSPHLSHGQLLSTTFRTREDVISNVMAAQLHHNPFLYHGDRPQATKKNTTRR